MNIADCNRTIEDEGSPAADTSLLEFSPDALLRVIWRRRWVVVLTSLMVVGCAALYLVLAAEQYVSTSRLYVERTGPKIISEQKGLMTQSRNYLFTQVELFRSGPILSQVLEDPQVRDLPILRDRRQPLSYLRNALNVTLGRKNDIISVALGYPDPQQAAQVVNVVVDSYIRYHENRKRTSHSTIRNILQTQKTDWEKELTEKHQALVAFSRANGLLAFEGDGANGVSQRLTHLSNALTQVQLTKIDTMALYEVVNLIVEDPEKVKQLAARYTQPLYLTHVNEQSELKKRLTGLRTELLILAKHATCDHPALRAKQSEIARLRLELAEHDSRFAQSYRASIIQQWTAAVEKENELQRALAQEQDRALQLDAKAALHSLLQADIRRTEQICDTLGNRIKEIDLTENTGALNITVLERASPHDIVRYRSRARTLLLALVAGLILGILSAFLLASVDHRLRSAAQITAAVAAPVIGTVPSMSPKESLKVHGLKVQLASSSAPAEAYRAIRTSIYFHLGANAKAADHGHGRTMLITSPLPGDGKSTLLSNLAIAMAHAGQRTLIIDADLRKPVQHTIFGAKPRRALTSILLGAADILPLIQHTDIGGLDILPCETKLRRPGDLLCRPRFADLLREVSEHYDIILVDSPPILSVADARILAGTCALTLLVVRAGKSTCRVAEHARQALLSVGAMPFAVVVNDVHDHKDYWGYYSRPGHYQTHSQPEPSHPDPAAVSAEKSNPQRPDPPNGVLT